LEYSLNFKDVFLSPNDLEILANARYGAIVSVHPESVRFLIEYGFISHYALSNAEHEFVITSLGVQYLEYLDSIILEKSKEEKRLKFAEIRSWISILISLIALIGSLMQWLRPISR